MRSNYFLCLVFFVDGLGGWMGESFDCFVGNRAMYRWLFFGISQATEATIVPCSCMGF